MPSIAARTWAGIGESTPTNFILKLNGEVNDGLANPAIRARLADIGTIPMVFTPDEFGATSTAATSLTLGAILALAVLSLLACLWFILPVVLRKRTGRR